MGKASPGRRQSFLARYTGRPPPPLPAYDGHRGGTRLRFCVNPTGQPVHRPTAQLTASRYRRAAWAPPASGVHRPTNRITPTPGENSGWPARQENGLTLVGTQPLGAGPASSLYISYGPCSSVPASGCHHRPVPDDRTGLPEQALNLLLLVVSPSGTRKTMTKSPSVTLSGRSADNLESGRPDNPRCPSIIHHQSPITNRLPHLKGAAFQ